jgi:uncharacterized repeat protein (TIGR01451 family)
LVRRAQRIAAPARAAAICLLPLAAASSLAVAGCGGSASLTVGVALAGGQSSSMTPGESAGFVITVTNTGPADFRYDDTTSIGGDGVRTRPVLPQVNSQQPEWGVWTLQNAGDTAQIAFQALAGGQPGSYSVAATASGSGGGSAQSPALALKLGAAAQLSATVSVSPNAAQPGQDVTYTVSVFNQGTGAAYGVDVLITLPPVFVYDGGEEILGDSSRGGGTNPVMGAELVFFDGFAIPPHSGATPGQLTIRFLAQILPKAGALGSYPVGVQVVAKLTQDAVPAAQVTIPAAAQVTVA